MTSPRLFVDKKVEAVESKEVKQDRKELGLIRLYLDFDGTLSGRRGSECVFSALYRTLQTDQKANYGDAKFVDEKEMVSKLKEGFEKPEYKTMQMSDGAFKFLDDMLDLNAEIILISRNRKEYIRAVLLNAGMSLEKLAKIDINDVNTLHAGKYGVVTGIERKATTKAQVTVVCDDDHGDYTQMTGAVKNANSATTLVSHCEAPGKFNWSEISKEAQEKAKLVVAPERLNAEVAKLAM